MEMALALAMLMAVILAIVFTGALVQAAPKAYRFHAASMVLIIAGAVVLVIMGWPIAWASMLAAGGFVLVATMMGIQWAIEKWIDPWLETNFTGPRKGHCTGCGYDLRGNPLATHCPECGEPVEPGNGPA